MPSVYKIRPDDAPQSSNLAWYGATRTVSLTGARNEHVPFPLVITTAPPPNRCLPAAAGFFVEAGDLVRHNGRIPREQIRLDLEHCVLCPRPSGPVGGAGFWPDALVPLTQPFDTRAEFRRAVRNRPLWVDIIVPENAAPGEYEGLLRVSHYAEPVAELRLRLNVHKFTLPRETHLITHIGLSAQRLARLRNLPERSPEARRLLMRYYRFLYENRMEPWFNELLEPEIARESGEMRLEFDRSAYQQYLTVWKTKRVLLETAPGRLRRMLEAQPFSESYSRQVRSYLSRVATRFRENGGSTGWF